LYLSFFPSIKGKSQIVCLFFDANKVTTKFYTKVVALSMQMLDRKPNEEPVTTVEEEAVEYEAEPA
jgi:hypothetical protein